MPTPDAPRPATPPPEPARRVTLALAEGRIEAAFWNEAGSAPALVLLHEGLGSVGLWRDFPARLAAATGCCVFAYSRFGYGRSDPTALPRALDYMWIEAVSILPRVLEAARLGGRLVLLGHSDGATIAAHAAAMEGDSLGDARLAGLVLLAPHFFVEPANIAAIRAIRADYDRTDLRARLARHHNRPDIAFLGWSGAWLDPAFPAQFDLTRELNAVRAPMLVVQGTADPYGTAAHARLAQRRCRGPVEVRALPCGHAPHLERPAEVVREVVRFISSLRAGARDDG